MYCTRCGSKIEKGCYYCIVCETKTKNIVNKLLSNKIICLMAILNLVLSSLRYICMATTDRSIFSGLWTLLLPFLLFVSQFFLWINLILSIINIKLPKSIFLYIISISSFITMCLAMPSNNLDILDFTYVIQTIIFDYILFAKITLYKQGRLLLQ